MLVFEYNDKRHHLINRWDEMTIKKAIQLMGVVNDFPDELKKLYRLSGDQKKQDEYDKIDKTISDKMRFKTIPELYGKIIVLMSDVSEESIKKWDSIERNAFYLNYCFQFIYGLLVMPANFEAKNITYFEFEGEKYYLPDSRMIMGNEKPFSKVTALEFSEVADLEIQSRELIGGRYEAAANIVSILCRPLGEEYDEEISLKRAEKFIDLPMSVVWEVFFYTLGYSTLLKQRDLIYLLRDRVKELQQQKGPDLINLDGMAT